MTRRRDRCHTQSRSTSRSPVTAVHIPTAADTNASMAGASDSRLSEALRPAWTCSAATPSPISSSTRKDKQCQKNECGLLSTVLAVTIAALGPGVTITPAQAATNDSEASTGRPSATTSSTTPWSSAALSTSDSYATTQTKANQILSGSRTTSAPTPSECGQLPRPFSGSY